MTRSKSESGYVLATTALLLIPLMIFAAFAVDVGAWYAEADETQRAADAAALAGVVWMPDFDKATAEARRVAKANGFDDADADVTVATEKRGTQGFYVNITTQGESHFGKVVSLNSIPINRFAAADFNLPVPMGSPQNILGYPTAEKIENGAVTAASYGGLTNCANIVAGFNAGYTCASGMMLTHHGHCQTPHVGDLRGGGFVQAANFDGNGCTIDVPDTVGSYAAGRDLISPASDTTAIPFPTHDPEGYFYVVEIPASATYTPSLWVFDAPYCDNDVVDGGGALRYFGDEGASNATGNRFQFRVWDMSITPLEESELNSPPTATWKVPTADLNECKQWRNTGITFNRNTSLDPGAPQRWYIQVTNDEAFRGGWAKGLSFYSMQVRMNNAETVCDNRSTPSCPQLYARDALPIRALVRTSGAVNLPTGFYLAQLDEYSHTGKTLEVTMYDVGENMSHVRFLDPGGNPLDFTWEITDGGPIDSSFPSPGSAPWPAEEQSGTGCAAASGANTSPCLNVAGSGFDMRYTAWDGTTPSYRLQGREVRVRISLDSANVTNWDMGGNGQGWFSVEYIPGSNAVDTTTWTVRVVGDPVRLTE